MFSVPHRRFVFHAKVDGHASVTPGGVVGCAHAVRRGRQRPPTARRDHRRITVLTAGDLFRCGGSACEGMRSTRISCELKRTRRRCSERGRSSPPMVAASKKCEGIRSPSRTPPGACPWTRCSEWKVRRRPCPLGSREDHGSARRAAGCVVRPAVTLGRRCEFHCHGLCPRMGCS